MYQLFEKEGCATLAQSYYKEFEELIKEGFISLGKIAQVAKQKREELDEQQQNESYTYRLAKETFQVFGTAPSKKDISELVKKILRIQKERELTIQQMFKNLKSYQEFRQMPGVNSNYGLAKWLCSEGSGYGKDRSEDIEREKNKAHSSFRKKNHQQQVESTPNRLSVVLTGFDKESEDYKRYRQAIAWGQKSIQTQGDIVRSLPKNPVELECKTNSHVS